MEQGEVASKQQLDAQTASILGLHTKNVAVITRVFLQQIVKALIDPGSVYFSELGLIKVLQRTGGVRPHVSSLYGKNPKKRTVPVPVKFFVRVNKSEKLRKILREHHGCSHTQPDEHANWKKK